MSAGAFYHRVSELDRKDLIGFLDHNQTELSIKINRQFVKANVNSIKNDKFFSVFKFHTFDFSNEEVICSFQYKDEVYFFKSFLNNSKADYIIDLPEEIFQLQRRNDFRVSIPIGTTQTCTINYCRGIVRNVSVEIRDLSLGGCQISVSARDIEIASGDEFDITFKMYDYEFAKLKLQTRHVKVLKEQESLLIGASFLPMDGDTMSDLRSLLMFLDRKSRGKKDD